MKPIIITVSGQARAGKGETCNILERKFNEIGKRCLQINYADYLKFIHAMYMGGDKDNIFARTPDSRTGWQLLGTEIVRKVDPNFWVDTVINTVKVIGGEYDYILISDSRFVNEIQRFAEEEYIVFPVHVERIGFDNGLSEEQKAHASEHGLDDYLFNHYIEAENNIESLEEKVENLFTFLVRGY